jgi:phosphatidylglycerophosphate synthase
VETKEASMSTDPTASRAADRPAPGRPQEIEAASNIYLVHPVSRALAGALAATPVTPNRVSVASVVASGAAAATYALLTWPWNAFVGLGFQYLWHVLDGADGDLARRTGRASPIGELVDGVCDHLSQGLIYVAFAIMAQRTIGPSAWAIGVAAAASHFLQANAYETGRKAYRHFIYNAPWMRQTGVGASGPGAILARFYLGVSDLLSPGEAATERAMDAAPGETARETYRAAFAPIVKASGVLASNARTLAAFLAVLACRPLWFFLFELTALNAALVVLALWRGRANARLVARLGAS